VPPFNEILFYGIVPAVLTIAVLCLTFRPWKPGNSGGAEGGAGRGRVSWGKDQLRAAALLIGAALITAHFAVRGDFAYPLESEDDHRLALFALATAAALFAPTLRVPEWVAVPARLLVSFAGIYLITFAYRLTGEWSDSQAIGYSALLGAGIATVWTIVIKASERAPAPVAPIALAAMAGCAVPIHTFQVKYATPGQFAGVIAVVAGLTMLLSFFRKRVTLGAAVGQITLILSALYIDSHRVSVGTAAPGDGPDFPWWWATLLIISPAFAGVALLPGINKWHPLARIALAALLTCAAPITFAALAIAGADLAAYGIGDSSSSEPAW